MLVFFDGRYLNTPAAVICVDDTEAFRDDVSSHRFSRFSDGDSAMPDLTIDNFTVNGDFVFSPGTSGGIRTTVAESGAYIAPVEVVPIEIVVPANSVILGVQMKVIEDLAEGELWDAEWNDGALFQRICMGQPVAKNTSVNRWFDGKSDWEVTSAATNILIKKNGGGIFTAQGAIRAIAYYQTWIDMEDVA